MRPELGKQLDAVDLEAREVAGVAYLQLDMKRLAVEHPEACRRQAQRDAGRDQQRQRRLDRDFGVDQSDRYADREQFTRPEIGGLDPDHAADTNLMLAENWPL